MSLESTIIVKPSDGRWSAWHNDKRVAGSNCRNCVVSLMLKLTKESVRYDNIVVVEENGLVIAEFPTGAANVRNCKES